MEKIFNLTSTFKTHAEEDGSVMIRGMASTVDFDRAGDSISAEAWQKGGMANFEKNPIILFNHDYDKPIGRATGLKAGPNGLEMEAKISKHAECAALIKDGVLGAFSVGFRVKDADYIKETDGLMIKDAELFEVSVVSVPCNQSATFSLAKSFDSTEEYEEFKKTFTNRVDLAGQSLAKDEDISSSVASDAPKSAEQSADQEIKMDNTQHIDLEAFAKQVADETAAKIAMKQAEQKAADQAEAKALADAKAADVLEGEKIQATIKTGVETGVESLVADLRKEFEAEASNQAEILSKYKTELEERSAEIQAMNNSKKSFSDRGNTEGMTAFAKEFMNAKILGQITGSGYDTDYAKGLMEKAGVGTAGPSATVTLDAIVATQFEKEMTLELKAASAFKEIAVNSALTLLPIQPESVAATFGNSSPDGTAGATTGADLRGNLAGTAQAAATFNAAQVTLKASRLTSTTFLTNDTDEQTLVSLLPMISDAMVRAHARAIDGMVVNGNGISGNGGEKGLADFAAANSGPLQVAETGSGIVDSVTGNTVLAARALMKKYGLNPSEMVLVVGIQAYNDLLGDANFQDITDVGSDLAIKVTGQIGSIFAIPVVVSDALNDDKTVGTAAAPCAILANTRNFVIPRLKGVGIETAYEVANQRTAIVAAQSIGFAELVTGNATAGRQAISIAYAAG